MRVFPQNLRHHTVKNPFENVKLFAFFSQICHFMILILIIRLTMRHPSIFISLFLLLTYTVVFIHYIYLTVDITLQMQFPNKKCNLAVKDDVLPTSNNLAVHEVVEISSTSLTTRILFPHQVSDCCGLFLN